jgi:hypothetical protein
MTALKLIEALLALLEAIPVLDRWFQQASIEYAKKQKEKNNVEYLAALAKAKGEKDVSDLAANIGKHLPD